MINEKTILIVDDDPISLHSASQMLSEYRLFSASSISEMHAFLESDIPDIILLDVMLPEMSGFDAAKILNAEFEQQQIPIVFCTAKTDGAHVRTGFESGGADYIKKPFDKDELCARIEVVLKRDQEQRRLLSEASIDVLTGLYNRRYFYRLLSDKISFCRRKKIACSIAMIDVDNFKSFNDKWGHITGDEVLRYFGETLLSMIREYDIACRFGGEEFVVALFDCDGESALPVVERIQQYLKIKPIILPEGEAALTFSCGIASTLECADDNLFDVDSLVFLADKRMYHAKELGRDRICIH